MKESTFSRKVTKFFVERNAFVFNVAGGEFQRPGMPDLLIMHRLLPKGSVWFELKTDNNTMSKIQRQVVKQITERGVDAYCLTLDEVSLWLTGHDDHLFGHFETLEDMWAYVIHRQTLP